MIRLQAHEHGRFGRAVKLLEVDADGSVKREQIGADGLPCGVRHAHPRKAQVVAQGAVNQPVPQGVQQTRAQTQRFAIHAIGAELTRHFHEIVKHLALERTGILHADHDAGEHALEHPRRREVIGRTDFFQIDVDGAEGLRAIDHIPTAQPLGVAENVLADPGRRQIGQHIFLGSELVELSAHHRTIEQTAVGVHHPFGVARGAGREKHSSHIVGSGSSDLFTHHIGMLLRVRQPGREQLLQ